VGVAVRLALVRCGRPSSLHPVGSRHHAECVGGRGKTGIVTTLAAGVAAACLGGAGPFVGGCRLERRGWASSCSSRGHRDQRVERGVAPGIRSLAASESTSRSPARRCRDHDRRPGRVTRLNAVAEGLTGWSTPRRSASRCTTCSSSSTSNAPAGESPVLRAQDGVVTGLANHPASVPTAAPFPSTCAAPIRTRRAGPRASSWCFGTSASNGASRRNARRRIASPPARRHRRILR
jgi:hypothetical protein